MLRRNELPAANHQVLEQQLSNLKSLGEKLASGVSSLFSSHGDGHFLRPDGSFADPGSDLSDLELISPTTKQPSSNSIIFINGMGTDPAKTLELARNLADSSGAPVLPLYNLSKGHGIDFTESLLDRMNLNQSGATLTLTKIITSSSLEQRPCHIAGYSQGALIVANAIFSAASTLRDDHGLSEERITELLAIHTVETYGGAASIYRDGPRYYHLVSHSDPIAWYLGVAKHGLDSDQIKEVESKLVSAEINSSIAPWIASATKNIGDAVTPGLWPGSPAQIIHIRPNEPKLTFQDHALKSYLSYRTDPSELNWDEESLSSDPEQRQRALRLHHSTPGSLAQTAANSVRSLLKRFSPKKSS